MAQKWTEQQDLVLLEKVQEGKSWEEIKYQYLSHRSVKALKKRYEKLKKKVSTQFQIRNLSLPHLTYQNFQSSLFYRSYYFFICNISYLVIREAFIFWLLGFIESDGSFQLVWREDKNNKSIGFQFIPFIRISQKDTGILQQIRSFLVSEGIQSEFKTYDPLLLKHKNRAASIDVRYFKNVQRFLEMIDSVVGQPFYGIKYQDFLIFKTIFKHFISNKKYKTIAGIKALIDFKFHLHQPIGQYVQNNSGKSRQEWEQIFNLPLGSSVGAAQVYLNQIQQKYLQHQTIVKSSIKRNSLKINPFYITGLIDGDGCFGGHLNFSKQTFSIQSYFKITVDIHSELIINVLTFYFKDQTPSIKYRPSKKKCIEFKTSSRKKVINNYIPHFQQYPLWTDKQNQFLIILKICNYFQKKKKKKHSVQKATKLIQFIYQNSSSNGPKQKLSLQEALNRLKLCRNVI